MKKGTRRKVNKSEAVRKYLTENPGVKPKQVSEALGKKGIKVSPQFVSSIKYQMGKQGGRPKNRRGRRGGASNLDANTLLKARKLADQLGGVQQAHDAFSALVKLQ